MTINRLFLQKLAVAFIVGAAPVLLAFVTGIGTHSVSITEASLLTLASGAIGAGIRAALVFLPVNLVPSDAEPVAVPKPAPPA